MKRVNGKGTAFRGILTMSALGLVMASQAGLAQSSGQAQQADQGKVSNEVTWEMDFNEVDINTNNAAEWPELNAAYNRQLNDAGWTQEDVLSRFDRNQDGILDAPEYTFFITALEGVQGKSQSGNAVANQQKNQAQKQKNQQAANQQNKNSQAGQSEQAKIAQQDQKNSQMEQGGDEFTKVEEKRVITGQDRDEVAQKNREETDLPRVSGITDWSEEDTAQEMENQQDQVTLQEQEREKLQPNVAGLRDQSDSETEQQQQDAVAQMDVNKQQAQERQQDAVAQNMQGQQATRSQQGQQATQIQQGQQVTRIQQGQQATQGQQGQQNQQAANEQGQRSPQGELVTLVAVTTVQEVPIADIEDQPVVNLRGQQIGEVEDVVVSQDGAETGLVVSVGGFWDIGDKDIYVDLDDVNMRADQVIWETMVSEDELQELPEYNEQDYVSVR